MASSSQSINIECGICTYEYDLNERLPTMGGCAHTFCKTCFDDMKSRNKGCPNRCPNTFTPGYSNLALVEVIRAQASAHLPIPKEESQISPNTNQREEIVPSILPSPPQPTPAPAPASVAPSIPQPTPSPAPISPEPSFYEQWHNQMTERWRAFSASPLMQQPLPASFYTEPSAYDQCRSKMTESWSSFSASPSMPQPIPTPTLPQVEPRIPQSQLTEYKVQKVFSQYMHGSSRCESPYGHIVPDTIKRMHDFTSRMQQPTSSSIPSTSQAPSFTDSDDFDAVKILNEDHRDALYAKYLAAFYERYPDSQCTEIPSSLTLEQQIKVLTGLTEQLSNNTRGTTNSQSSQVQPIRHRFSRR